MIVLYPAEPTAVCAAACIAYDKLLQAKTDAIPTFYKLEVLAHLLLYPTLHTQLHHLSASQRFIQMTGPNSWLCPLHCNILRKRNKPDPDVQSYISPAFSGIFLK